MLLFNRLSVKTRWWKKMLVTFTRSRKQSKNSKMPDINSLKLKGVKNATTLNGVTQVRARIGSSMPLIKKKTRHLIKSAQKSRKRLLKAGRRQDGLVNSHSFAKLLIKTCMSIKRSMQSGGITSMIWMESTTLYSWRLITIERLIVR